MSVHVVPAAAIVQVIDVAPPFLNTVAVAVEVAGSADVVMTKACCVPAVATVVSHVPGLVAVASTQAADSEPYLIVPEAPKLALAELPE
jgi:hypothetical protein